MPSTISRRLSRRHKSGDYRGVLDNSKAEQLVDFEKAWNIQDMTAGRKCESPFTHFSRRFVFYLADAALMFLIPAGVMVAAIACILIISHSDSYTSQMLVGLVILYSSVIIIDSQITAKQSRTILDLKSTSILLFAYTVEIFSCFGVLSLILFIAQYGEDVIVHYNEQVHTPLSSYATQAIIGWNEVLQFFYCVILFGRSLKVAARRVYGKDHMVFGSFLVVRIIHIYKSLPWHKLIERIVWYDREIMMKLTKDSPKRQT